MYRLGSGTARVRQVVARVSPAFAALWLAAAGVACSTEKRVDSPCAGDSSDCGAACSLSHPCPAGLYCAADELCAKACDDAHACPNGGVCTSKGECLMGGTSRGGTSGGTAGKSGATRDGGLGFGDSSGIMLPDAGNQTLDPMPKTVCASSDVVAGRVIPTVILIIDQSSSMDETLGSGTRWNVLRDFLLKDGGLIKTLQDRVRFGVAMYSADSNVPQTCPIVTRVAPAINNWEAINTAYRAAEPIDDTPTGDSIDNVLASLPKPAPDAPQDPVVFVLATDGEPDRCEEPDPQNGQGETIDAVKRAFGMNIKTFVIGVGNEISATHQQDVANAGVGQQAGQPNAPFWTASDDQSLRTALTDIVGAQVSCDVELKGRVEGDACAGTVLQGDIPLKCKDKDGWELVDTNHVRLLGKACDSFKMEKVSTLHVTFPCAAVILD